MYTYIYIQSYIHIHTPMYNIYCIFIYTTIIYFSDFSRIELHGLAVIQPSSVRFRLVLYCYFDFNDSFNGQTKNNSW